MLVSLLIRCYLIFMTTLRFLPIFIFIILFIYWLCGVFIVACRLSLVAASGSYSLVAMCGLLIVVASLTVKHRFWGAQASVAVVHGFSCPEACGIFPDQGLNPGPLQWRQILNHWTTQGSPVSLFF